MDDIRKLARVEKEKVYSADIEINNPIPTGAHSAEDVDDLVKAIRTRGLDVLEGEPQLPYSALEQRLLANQTKLMSTR